jgi:hypothetical protein
VQHWQADCSRSLVSCVSHVLPQVLQQIVKGKLSFVSCVACVLHILRHNLLISLVSCVARVLLQIVNVHLMREQQLPSAASTACQQFCSGLLCFITHGDYAPLARTTGPPPKQ